MKILTLNVRHGGGSRSTLISEYLQASNADVIAISEFRNGPSGDRLRSSLDAVG